jgi:hypothetical protein
MVMAMVTPIAMVMRDGAGAMMMPMGTDTGRV